MVFLPRCKECLHLSQMQSEWNDSILCRFAAGKMFSSFLLMTVKKLDAKSNFPAASRPGKFLPLWFSFVEDVKLNDKAPYAVYFSDKMYFSYWLYHRVPRNKITCDFYLTTMVPVLRHIMVKSWNYVSFYKRLINSAAIEPPPLAVGKGLTISIHHNILSTSALWQSE